MSQVNTKDDVPQLVLYACPASAWSKVPMLCLFEDGYGEDDYCLKQIDLGNGEEQNFSPSYLKINKNGTVPTLVVPIAETTSRDADSQYRSLCDAITICNFLDHERKRDTSNTTSNRPAQFLAPRTAEGKSINDEVIDLVNLESVDPNFLSLAGRDESELRRKAAGSPGATVRNRRSSLERYIGEAKQSPANGGPIKTGNIRLLEERYAAHEVIWKVYNREATPDDMTMYYEASQKIWNASLPDVLDRLEGLIQDSGPFILGHEVSLADLHAIAWLARIIGIASDTIPAHDIDALERHLGGRKIGTKVRAFWAAWLARESFKKTVGDNSPVPTYP